MVIAIGSYYFCAIHFVLVAEAKLCRFPASSSDGKFTFRRLEAKIHANANQFAFALGSYYLCGPKNGLS